MTPAAASFIIRKAQDELRNLKALESRCSRSTVLEHLQADIQELENLILEIQELEKTIAALKAGQ